MRLSVAGPAVLAAAICSGAVAGCSGGSAFDTNLGVTASPRVAADGPIRKGGGIYKVGRPYRVGGRWYHPHENPNYDRVGTASWYGTAFHGRRTSNGEIYDMHALTAGHPTMPMPSYAYVTNLQNGRTVLVRVNDRGPYARDRLIDLSYRTAHTLGFHNQGTARVRVRYAGRAPLNGDDSAERRFLAQQSWYGGPKVAEAATSTMTTGSLSTRRVRSVGYSGAGAPQQTPVWSVQQYRRGELDSAKQAESILTKPPVDTYVRVGPFPTREEAERLRHMLGGVESSVVEQSTVESAYRVRLGPYDDADAAAAMTRIVAAGFDPEASSHPATGEGARNR
jgi:rare lipoprotein A